MENVNGFLNQVVVLNTRLTAHDLMDTLLSIENQMGRVRTKTSKTPHYESRVIDIDILLYNNSIIATEQITIPHPLLHLRKFVLEPFSELDENQVHPILNKSIKTLLAECRDVYEVEKSMSK
jgi:2-amino-4-hydroxy-6-hydroxymethyldihydropteridine diphosphokinase